MQKSAASFKLSIYDKTKFLSDFFRILFSISSVSRPIYFGWVIESIKETYQNLSKYIFNFDSNRLVMDNLTVLGDWKWRMECLFAGLVLHFSCLSKCNPLKNSMNPLNMQDNKPFLLFSFQRSKLLDAYNTKNGRWLFPSGWKRCTHQSITCWTKWIGQLMFYCRGKRNSSRLVYNLRL
jgi:hypothetical protein